MSNSGISTKLHSKLIIEGKIRLVTGLHIGGSNSGMDIGGIAAEVIRNPTDKRPYIPGSSLKGKLRSLLEISNGRMGQVKSGNITHGPTDNPGHSEAQLFGFVKMERRNEKREAQHPEKPENEAQRPSRLIVRDGYLETKDDFFHQTDLYLSQSKTEVTLDRITAKANPRTMERVPEGAEFGLRMILNLFEGDERSEYLSALFKAMRLLQDDYLGGKGSRGSGQVDILISRITEKTMDHYRDPLAHPARDITAECGLPESLVAYLFYANPA